jgi:hypothetical protein
MPKIIREEQGLTWTCHICGQERPDAMIGVEKHKTLMPGTNLRVEESVRYCRDKAECMNAAPNFSFIKPKTPVVASRSGQMPGVAVPNDRLSVEEDD